MGDWSLFGVVLTPYLTAKTIGTVIRIGVLLFLGIPLVYWASRRVRLMMLLRRRQLYAQVRGPGAQR